MVTTALDAPDTNPNPSPNPNPTPNLLRALIAARAAVEVVEKDKQAVVRSKDGDRVLYTYKFAGGDDLCLAGKAALGAHDLSLSPRPGPGWSIDRADGRAYLVLHLALEHGPSGEFRDYDPRMPLSSANDGDKVVAGGITYTLANFYRTLLGIARSDEEAGDEPDRRKAPARSLDDDEPRSSRRVVNGTGDRTEARATAATPAAAAANVDPELVSARAAMRVEWGKFAKALALRHPDVTPDLGAVMRQGAPLGLDAKGQPRPWPMHATLADYRTLTAHLAELAAELTDGDGEGFDFGGPQ